MTLASIDQLGSSEPFIADIEKQRRAAMAADPAILGEIYQDDINIAIWERELTSTLQESVAEFVAANRSFQASFTVAPDCALRGIRNVLAGTGQAELSEDIASLVEMFAFLFDIRRVGLRLATLDRAMCPRFHVDKVPCRMVATYHGVATEWLPHEAVDRSRLGPAGHGSADNVSGVFRASNDIQQLGCGAVALLKGELWEGNENAGLVHRSPAVDIDESRLLLTLDFCN